MSRVNDLLNASEEPIVAFTQFIKSIGRNGDKVVIGVEGHDDVTFYQSVFLRIASDKLNSIAFENLKGKTNVLEVYWLVLNSDEIDSARTRFIVDRDFDGMRGYDINDILWMTPTYSIENMLVSESSLKLLLQGEYRCVGEIGEKDATAVIEKYRAIMDDYKNKLYFANLCIFYCVTNSVKINPNEETITRRISCDSNAITFEVSEDMLLSSIPKGDDLVREQVLSVNPEFLELDPFQHWRGKFIFQIFVQFLSSLRKDRGSKNPSDFSHKASMTYNPENDSIRGLASTALLPVSLVEFINTI